MGLASAVVSPDAASAAEQWRQDIPRVVKGLKDYLEQWDDINAEGLATKGANRLREGLLIKYIDAREVVVPSGEPLGVNVVNGVVRSVSNTNLGWEEGDDIARVNGVAVNHNDLDLQRLLKAAKEDGTPLKLRVERAGPPLFDNLESKVQNAYMEVGDDSMSDMEELQLTISNTKVQANMAASATAVTPAAMNSLKKVLGQCVKELAPLVQAMKG